MTRDSNNEDIHVKGIDVFFAGPICSYSLEWDDSTSKSVDDIPFRVDLVDRKTGKAHLRLKEGESVKCGETSHYSLLITGKGCDNGKTTDR